MGLETETGLGQNVGRALAHIDVRGRAEVADDVRASLRLVLPLRPRYGFRLRGTHLPQRRQPLPYTHTSTCARFAIIPVISVVTTSSPVPGASLFACVTRLASAFFIMVACLARPCGPVGLGRPDSQGLPGSHRYSVVKFNNDRDISSLGARPTSRWSNNEVVYQRYAVAFG